MGKSNSSRGQTPQSQSQPVANTPSHSSAKRRKAKSYRSDGVEDNDVFLLPISDYQIMMALTVLSVLVRLFRIYQPTSVVFDEVQYV